MDEVGVMQHSDESAATAAHSVESPALQAEIEDLMQVFRQQFPMDEAAYNYIVNSPPGVQTQVLRDFHPPREGESDYSALIIAFTKRCRMSGQMARHPPTMPSFGQFKVPPATRTGGHLSEQTVHDADGLRAAVNAFRERYPFDEEAYNYLVGSPQDVQAKILQDFRAKREGEGDYSALVISFSKRCRTAAANISYQMMPSGYAAAQMSSSLGAAAFPVQAAPRFQGHSAPALPFAEYEAFRARYPFDEQAHNYLMNSTPQVQMAVLRNFKPPREGEGDYSALLISYTKRSRSSVHSVVNVRQHMGRACFGPPGGLAPPTWTRPRPWRPLAPGPPLGLGPLGFGHGAGLRAGSESEAFRRRFPMDDRAFAYLLESPPQVRQQVMETFSPPRADDTDFSAPVVAYSKRCRARFGEVAHGTNQYFSGLQPAMPAPGYVTEGDVGAFMARYPVDARAEDYLRETPPVVVARVLREFRPKREGDSDYSAAVVSFVGLCRKEAGGEAGGPGAFQKRARVGY